MTHLRRPSPDQIDAWIREFQHGAASRADVRVMALGDEDDEDAGVVVMRLNHVPDSIFLDIGSQMQWVVVFAERFAALTIPGADLAALAAELTAADELCKHLQMKTDQWVRSAGLS